MPAYDGLAGRFRVSCRACPRWLLLAVAIGTWLLPARAPALTFLLTSTSDLSDVVPGDGSCSTGGTVDLGSGPIPACGLRAAIQEANASPGADHVGVHPKMPLDGIGQIQFDPTSPYPTITDTLTIDGTEAPGYDPGNPNQKPLIQIDGAQTPAGSDGLRLSGVGHRILALAIYRFPDEGIVLTGAEQAVIQGCHIGVRRGSAANGNGGHGIELSNSDANTIGQTFDLIDGWTGQRNVISANAAAGIRIVGDGNLVAGNRIGTDPSGNSINPPFNGFMGNGDIGVHVLSGFGNEVGGLAQLFDGTPVASGNLISGNRAGVVTDVLTGATSIFGNQIGTNAAGTSALGNTDHGILVDSSPFPTIGGFDVGGNVVAGTTAGHGIQVLDSSYALVVGNTVGLSAEQSSALVNDLSAIIIDGGTGHGVIDNVTASAFAGIALANVTDTAILGNRVGNTEAGQTFGAGTTGIAIDDSENVVVGVPGAGNVVGPAFFGGIQLISSTDISVEGNWVGVDPSGTALPITMEAIDLVLSNGNSIGGADAGAGNVVGNASRGIHLSSSVNNDIAGNLVGTEGTGQDMGTSIGIHLEGADANRIGGELPGESNTIGFSSNRGVWIDGDLNSFEGNFVGTDALGRVMGSGTEGIAVEGNTNRIGVDGASGAGNTIAYNGGAGVLVSFGAGVLVVENAIFENGGLGIDLAPVGATPNDPGDADTGPNDLQNFPEVVGASVDDATGEVVVSYTLDTPGASPFQIDFYLADVDEEEGQTWIGRDTYAAGGAAQEARFLPPAGVTVDASNVVVLTATGPSFLSGLQTSEFGGPVPLPEPGVAVGLGAAVLLLSLLARRRRVRCPNLIERASRTDFGSGIGERSCVLGTSDKYRSSQLSTR